MHSQAHTESHSTHVVSGSRGLVAEFLCGGGVVLAVRVDVAVHLHLLLARRLGPALALALQNSVRVRAGAGERGVRWRSCVWKRVHGAHGIRMRKHHPARTFAWRAQHTLASLLLCTASSTSAVSSVSSSSPSFFFLPRTPSTTLAPPVRFRCLLISSTICFANPTCRPLYSSDTLRWRWRWRLFVRACALRFGSLGLDHADRKLTKRESLGMKRTALQNELWRKQRKRQERQGRPRTRRAEG